jgi:hypothetical protein
VWSVPKEYGLRQYNNTTDIMPMTALGGILRDTLFRLVPIPELQLDIPFDTRHDANMMLFFLRPRWDFSYRYDPAWRNASAVGSFI